MQLSSPQAATVVEIVLEPGDELIESLRRAIAQAGSTEAFLVGSGELEDVELTTLSSSGGARSEHKLRGACDLLTLSGSSSNGSLELRATVARETELGSQLAGGILVKATVVSAHVRAVLRASTSTRPSDQEPLVPSATPSRPSDAASLPLPPPRDSAPQIRDERPSALGATAAPAGPPLPPKLRRADSPDLYPEENDVVTHFAFGRCVVLFSDGERIRFQQERDGRVREVALSMLRIGEPTVDAEGRRHWELARKN